MIIDKKKTGTDGKQQGFSLIEVLIAMAILSIGLLAIASMQIGAINGNVSANRRSVSEKLGTDTMERLIRLNWSDSDLSIGNHTDPGNPIDGIYTIGWVVSGGPGGTRQIVVTVSWSEKGATVTNQFEYLKVNA